MSESLADAALAEYRRYVAANGSADAAVNRGDVFAMVADGLRDRIHSGELEIPIEDALHHVLSEIDRREGQAADSVLAKIARGEVGLDVWPDPMLNVVVTLGGGRRKAWKHVTAADLADMADLRNRNTKSARNSERRFIRDIARVHSDLVLAGSVEQMVSAARLAATA